MGSVTKVASASGKTCYKAEARVGSRRKSKRCATKKEATAWWKAEEVQLAKLGKSTAKGVTYGHALERFIKEVAPKRKSARDDINRCRRAQEMPIGDVLLEDMTLQHGKDHLAFLQEYLCNDSAIREFNMLKVVLRECSGWYNLPYPWKGLTMPTKADPRERLLTDEEYEQFVMMTGYDIADAPVTTRQKVGCIFTLAVETGMRAGEIVALEPRHLDMPRKVVMLSAGMTKSAVKREVPMSPTAVRIFKKLLARRPPVAPKDPRLFGISANTLSTTFGDVRAMCGYTDKTTWYRFHDARHMACTRMSRMPSMSALKLAKIMGHADVKMTMTYFNEDMSRVSREMRDHEKALSMGSDFVDMLQVLGMSLKEFDAKRAAVGK